MGSRPANDSPISKSTSGIAVLRRRQSHEARDYPRMLLPIHDKLLGFGGPKSRRSLLELLILKWLVRNPPFNHRLLRLGSCEDVLWGRCNEARKPNKAQQTCRENHLEGITEANNRQAPRRITTTGRVRFICSIGAERAVRRMTRGSSIPAASTGQDLDEGRGPCAKEAGSGDSDMIEVEGSVDVAVLVNFNQVLALLRRRLDCRALEVPCRPSTEGFRVDVGCKDRLAACSLEAWLIDGINPG